MTLGQTISGLFLSAAIDGQNGSCRRRENPCAEEFAQMNAPTLSLAAQRSATSVAMPHFRTGRTGCHKTSVSGGTAGVTRDDYWVVYADEYGQQYLVKPPLLRNSVLHADPKKQHITILYDVGLTFNSQLAGCFCSFP